MIILPDRNIPRAKFLLPVCSKEWREPSQSVPLDMFNNPTHMVRFKLRAKTHDGVVLWTGWFESREDFDAFLFALFTGTLERQSVLWDLPTPSWPNLDPGLIYDFATTTYITATGTGTYSRPNDWNDNNNYIHAVGAGGYSTPGAYNSAGGGGGAWAGKANLTLSASTSYRVGLSGTTGAFGNSTTIDYTGNSWFSALSVVNAASGRTGGTGTAGVAGGIAGSTTYSVGDSTFSGGTGGARLDAAGPGGGGGAAGADGAGVVGNSASGLTPIQSGGAGGAGNNNTNGGGAGGLAQSTAAGTGNPGGNGTNFGNNYGSGGGGGAGYYGYQGGTPGSYGAGAGGGGGTNVAGANGLLVIEYTPIVTGFNMPMLGM